MERDKNYGVFSYGVTLDKNAEIMDLMMEHAQQLNELLDNAKYQEQLDNFDQQLKLSKAIRLLSETSHIMANELYRITNEIEHMKETIEKLNNN